MPDVDKMDLEDVEDRLDELRAEKDRAEDFRDLVGGTSDNLNDIQASEFVDDEAAAQVRLLRRMLDWIIHHNVLAEERIRYERELLRRRRIELQRQPEEGTDA